MEPECHCSDPRDYIYAVLGLVKYKKKPIVPDYNKTPIELATEVIPHYTCLNEIPQLFDRLQLNHAQPELHEFLTSTSRNRYAWYQEKITLAAGTRSPISITTPCATLRRLENGRLMAALHNTSTPAMGSAWHAMSAAYGLARAEWERTCPSRLPIHLKNEAGETAALVASTAKAGDIVVPISATELRDANFLVLRKREGEGEVFDVVGQGILLPGWEITEMNTDVFVNFHVDPEMRRGFVFEVRMRVRMGVWESGEGCWVGFCGFGDM